jgi:KUP system potassium uptake protein
MSSDRGTWRLALAASGVVFGDIGISLLYAFGENFIGHHRLPVDQPHVLAVISTLL